MNKIETTEICPRCGKQLKQVVVHPFCDCNVSIIMETMPKSDLDKLKAVLDELKVDYEVVNAEEADGFILWANIGHRGQIILEFTKEGDLIR